MNMIWTIIPIVVLLYAAVTILLSQIAWRDFRRRKFSSLEEKQRFKRMLLSWGGSYRYLRGVRRKGLPLALPYAKILSAITLLILVWLLGRDGPLGPRLIITAIALTSLYESYVSIKSPPMQ
jgi:hypothetical protein